MRFYRLVALFWLLPALAWAQGGGAQGSEDAAAPATTAPVVNPPVADSTVSNAVANSILPRDLSVWGMFVQADWLVQAVLIGLAFASVLTWTVFVAKSLELAAAARRQRATLAAVDAAPSLA
jgi:biopolymer transport protein ExbB